MSSLSCVVASGGFASPGKPHRPFRAAMVALALGTLLGLGSAAGAAQTSPEAIDLNAREKFYLEAHGTIRYVMPLELPPTVFTGEDGKVKGIAIDLLNVISVRLGVEFAVVRSDNFSHALDMVRTGEADLIGPLTPSQDREPEFDFTPPFIQGSLGYWTAGDGAPLDDPADLAGRPVAVIGGATSSGWIEENRPDIVRVAANDTLDGLRMLERGGVDAFFGSFALAAYYVDREGLADLHPLGEPIVFADGAWAVADGNFELLSIMNKGMAAVGKQDLTAIYVKWTGYDLGLADENRVVPFYENRWFQGGLLAAVGLTAGLMLWTWSLRREVRRRTQELGHANDYLSRLIGASPIGILSVGPNGRILNANPAFERMLGFEVGELTGEHIVDLTYVDDHEPSKAALANIGSGRIDAIDFEKRYRRVDGTPVWTHVRAAAVRGSDGVVAHTVSLVTDLTEERKAQAARGRALEQDQENRRLREIDEFKTQFFNAVAHELNTPLTPIQVHLHMLRTEKLGELNPQQAESVALLDRNLTRVGRLVADMLDVARLQNGRIELRRRRFDMAHAVHEAIDTFQPAAAAKGLSLEVYVDDDLAVDADPDRVAQILLNLLSNAVKYTERGTVTVHAARDGHGVRVEVSDTGPGLTNEQREQLFQPFSQVHAPGGITTESTGLGLFICRGLVELHGGTIWAQSDGGDHGSVFGFDIPAAPPTPPDSAERLEQTPVKRSRH